MPSAIWAGQLGHDERGAIGIFLGSLLVFGIGTGMVQTVKR